MAIAAKNDDEWGDWVKQHRSVMEHALWSDPFLFQLFSWCVMKAAWRKMKSAGIPIERGQFITGRNRASEELHVSPSKWYRGIQALASPEFGCISVEVNSKWTRITVCNYKLYQGGSGKSEQQVNSVRTASEQHVNTIKEIKNPRTQETLSHSARGNEFEIPESWKTPTLVSALDQWASHLRSGGKNFGQQQLDAVLALHRNLGWTPERLERGITLSISRGSIGTIIDPDEAQRQQSRPAGSFGRPAKDYSITKLD